MENRQLLKKIGSLEQRILELEKKNSLLVGQLMARDMVERNHEKELDRLWAVLNNKNKYFFVIKFTFKYIFV